MSARKMNSSGFTLIEVVVVVGVMVVVSSVMLINFPHLRGRAELGREAGKLVLALRKAQSYALAVQEFTKGINNDPFCDPANAPVRFPGYGVYFTTSDIFRYLIFGDATCSRQYESFPLDEMVEVVNLEQGAFLKSIKGFDASLCSPALGGCELGELAVLYLRPGPITILTNDGVKEFSFVEITLSAAAGAEYQTVVVRSTGQVSIE